MNRIYCKHLRNKTMFVLADAQEALAERENGECGCNSWCNLTQTVVGPDNRPVQTNHCNAARLCFEQ